MKRFLVIFLIIFGVALLITALVFVFRDNNDSSSGNQKTSKEFGIFVSHDGGSSWEGVPNTEGIRVLALDFKKNDPSQLYIGTAREGLLRYDAIEESTKKINDPENILPPDANIYAIDQSNDGEILYLATFYDNHGHVIRITEDKAEEKYKTELPKYGIFNIVVNPRNSNVMTITSGDGSILQSIDAGKSWEVISRTAEGIVLLEKHPTKEGKFWAIGNKGTFYETESGGRLWLEKPDIQIDRDRVKVIHSLSYHAQRNSLLAATDLGLIETYNDGTSWNIFQTLVTPKTTPITAVEAHPRFSEVFLMAAGNNLHRTEDGGITWSSYPIPTEKTISMVKINTSNPKIIYAAVTQ